MLRFTSCLSALLATAVLWALPAEAQQAAPLRVATFRCDVTPPVGGHPLIWTTSAKTIEDPLWAKGIVVDDGKTRCVLCVVDWCGLCNSSYDLFRGKLAEAVGTDVKNVAVQTVHQHTAPYTDGDAQKILSQYENPPKFVDFQFLEEVTDRLAASAKEAVEKLQPFDSIGVGQAQVHEVAATRRVVGPDGKIQVRYSSCKDPALRAMPEGRIDPFLKTVTLAQGDKPLVRLHYYATHPQTFYGDARASADCVGHARDRLEKEEGVFQIYFTGCGGDVTMGKYNDGSREAREPITQRLLAGMKDSVAATKYQPAGSLSWRTVPVAFDRRTDGSYALEPSLATAANPKAGEVARTVAACRAAFNRRADRPYDLSCLEIGDVRLVNLPGECLIEFQFFTQQLLPEKFVAVAAYGDLSTGYICPEKAFTEGGYEPTDANTAPTSEQKLKAAIRQLLGVQ
jgi:hypothetical protein